MDFFTKSAMFSNCILAFVIFMSCIPPGLAVFCYECNTLDDPRCMDPFTKPSDIYINCSIEYPEATFCRKIDQTLSKAKENKHRIFRRCAWEAHKNKDCYRGTSRDYNAEICICRDDGCNEAPQSIRIASFVVVVAAAILGLVVRHLVAT